ncbi:RRP15-like protein [Anopheles nili]|uniref:RRP15-like protein n=1 Tax=Anopheles nili TaxID=185578 RepID=UPI00237BA03D|nr:RRP15-like protein [Anopheles nili]
MLKPARKPLVNPTATTDSDSDSLPDDNSEGNEFLSDEEYPMSEDDGSVELDDGNDEAAEETEQPDEPTKWAKAMAKFLRKTIDGKILSKAITDEQKERKKNEPKKHEFDVVSAEGTVKQESTTKTEEEDKPSDLKLAQELLRQKALLKKERQKDILGLRMKPTIHDYERERTLRKVATRGTVQLFNAVRTQQKNVGKRLEEAGKLEYKREKVLKSLNKKEFLDVLMNGPRAKSELVDNLVKKEEEDDVKSEVDSDEEPKSTWGALRADFLTGKKSGWDKEDEEEDSKVPDDLDDAMGSSSDMD